MTKLNFDEMMSKTDETLHNSNMLNIVNAVRTAEDAIAEAKHDIVFYEKTIEELKALANNEDAVQVTSEVQRLHKARPPEFKGRRW